MIWPVVVLVLGLLVILGCEYGGVRKFLEAVDEGLAGRALFKRLVLFGLGSALGAVTAGLGFLWLVYAVLVHHGVI